MLVVGGRAQFQYSQKLFEICKKECGNTYYTNTCRLDSGNVLNAEVM